RAVVVRPARQSARCRAWRSDGRAQSPRESAVQECSWLYASPGRIGAQPLRVNRYGRAHRRKPIQRLGVLRPHPRAAETVVRADRLRLLGRVYSSPRARAVLLQRKPLIANRIAPVARRNDTTVVIPVHLARLRADANLAVRRRTIAAQS